MTRALLENIRLGLAALITNKVRSLLTMLGIIIGVYAITLLIGIGEGVKHDVQQQVTELGSNVLYVLPGQLRNPGGGFNPSASLGVSTLTEDDVAALRGLPEVRATAMLSLLAGLPRAGERTDPASFNLAVEPSFFSIITTAKLVAGRTFTDEDEAAAAKVMLLDTGPRTALFPGVAASEVVGKTVQFHGEDYSVIGVLETPQADSVFGTSPNFTAALYVPYATAKKAIANTQVFRIVVQVDPAADSNDVAPIIKQTVLSSHKNVEDFTVFTQDDLLRVIDEILTILTSAVVGLGAISLLVGGIGIMNIMLVSVTERTKEIGLRKAIGASNGNILFQFLTEAVMLSVVGGALGLGIAFVTSIVVTAKAPLTILLSANTVGIAFGFSLLVGIVFGVAPAIRASRLNPIEALRYE